VVVVDAVEDPLWADYLNLVDQYKIRACWSQPIFSIDRTVLGTIALFYSRPKQPTAADLEHLKAAGNLASIALRCDQAEQQRRAAHKRLLKQKATLVELATSELLMDIAGLLT
jgi:GAF domain-containing protein